MMSSTDNAIAHNVVDRLRDGILQAKRMGFRVRVEPLEDGQAGWCQIGSKTMIFIDASLSANEQLSQLGETVADYQHSQVAPNSTEAA